MTPIELIQLCAPEVAPVTLAAIVQQESGGNPLLLHDNTTRSTLHPASRTEAEKLAQSLIRSGHSVDIGLAQINSHNLPALRLSVVDVLDPCTNLHAAQSVLLAAWRQSGHDLPSALAAYNTGETTTTIGKRYSAQVFTNAGVKVPAIPGGTLAHWATHDQAWIPSTLSPVRLKMTWTPAASPLHPNHEGMSPSGIPTQPGF